MAQKFVVIGAGAFGGWSALHLLRSGAQVTLVDAWGPGNSRASSGGETRVIRHAYADPLYVDLAGRSLELWREHCDRWQMSLYRECGVLFFDQGGDFCDLARRNFEAAGIAHETLSIAQIALRWPQVNIEGLRSGLFEPGAGYLQARRACQAVVSAFVREGGDFRIANVQPGDAFGNEMQPPTLQDGESLMADQYVFACGPWLPSLFPFLASVLSVSRQELFFFGQPPDRHNEFSRELPVWAEVGDHFWYGIPGDGKRGFKLGDDTTGPKFDPTHGDRSASVTGIESAREYMEFRFPGMRASPLLESRVCQYTKTSDDHFIIDRHPQAENCWIAGGGSGHGFKHGPAIGEYLASLICGKEKEKQEFRLDRDYTSKKQVG